MALTLLNLRTPPVERRSILDVPGNLNNLGAIWSWISGSEPTASGELIDEHVALQIITVYSCVRLIAETVGSLPLKLYERQAKGRLEALDNYLYDILTVAPNPEMSAPVFWETVVGCMALCGNSYSQIQRNPAGQPMALWPLHPRHTKPVRLPDGTLAYQTLDDTGTRQGQIRIVAASDILHFKLFGWDGLIGLSPIQMSRQDLGLMRAAIKMGSRLFANGGRPAGIITEEGTVTHDIKLLQSVRESWQAAQTGENSLKTAFLPGNWKYTPMSLDMESIEFLKTRAFQRTEIAALFKVPAHLIGDTTRQSNTNSEQEALTLITLCLRPYLSKIEAEVKRVLLPTIGRNANRFFVEFDTRALLRGDFKTEMDGFAIGKQWGFFSTNEVKEAMGDNPIGPEGDVYLYPLTHGNAANLLNPPVPAETSPAPGANSDAPHEAAPEPSGDTTQEPSNDTAPTQDERTVLERYTGAFIRMFRDGFGRVSSRDKRDLGTITNVFEPLCISICELCEDQAALRFSLPETWNPPTDRIVRDALKGLAKRCADWTPEAAETMAPAEFMKLLRGIMLSVNRDAGAQCADLPALAA